MLKYVKPSCYLFLSLVAKSIINFVVYYFIIKFPGVCKEKMLVPEEQLSKLRSPRMTSKATWSSRTFSSSEGPEVALLNSAPHSSNISNCSQRTAESPERGRQVYTNNTQELKCNKTLDFILWWVLFNKVRTERIVQNNSFDFSVI